MRYLVFDIYIEEYADHKVMRQSDLYQASHVLVTHSFSGSA
jgi:hypothetical protein